MGYTVKKLAKLSGVSVRTLHWYDEIGLLKPAYLGENAYRYYEEEQLLLLQQILFFKELGFPLNDIQKLLKQDDFDQIKALRAHRKIMEENLARQHQLIETIDKTIQHLEGKQTMTDEELYYGFGKKIPKSGQYLIECAGTAAEAMLAYFKKDEEIWSDKQWVDFKNEVDYLDRSIAKLIEQGLGPERDEVQKLIHRHYELQENFFNLTKEAYTALIQMYEDANPEFKKFFEVYHPKMQEFMCKAMKVYADRNL